MAVTTSCPSHTGPHKTSKWDLAMTEDDHRGQNDCVRPARFNQRTLPCHYFEFSISRFHNTNYHPFSPAPLGAGHWGSSLCMAVRIFPPRLLPPALSPVGVQTGKVELSCFQFGAPVSAWVCQPLQSVSSVCVCVFNLYSLLALKLTAG